MVTIEQRVETKDRVGLESASPLLEVEDLHVQFLTSRGIVRAVEGLSFHVDPGEIVAIVGESGSGKSVSALSIMRLLPRHTGRIPKGRVTFNGRDLLKLSDEQMREIRGRDISMIFQEPMTSLNPILTIGMQLTEPLLIHMGMTTEQARARAIELLGLVGIPDPARRLEQYPHQFSGGMRQRVMIAIGLACNPKLIIADEPTTALDVTIQAQILELMKNLSRKLNIALIVITHNLGVVARYADRVIVMYSSQLVEENDADDVFHRPRHPYSMGLLRSVPRLDRPRGAKLETIEGLPPNAAAPPPGCRFAPRCPYKIAICETEPRLLRTDTGGLSRCHRHEEIAEGKIVWTAADQALQTSITKTGTPLLSVRHLTKHFEVRGGLRAASGTVRAVQDVSFDILPGETLGLVGESGCGKTTVGRLILRLEDPTEGELRFEGRDLTTASAADMKAVRRKIQVIFQDPYSSLNPRMTVGQIIGEPLHVYKLVPNRKGENERVAQLLEQVGLRPEMAARYPHQLSGGQRQRVGIARALAMEPSFIVCDEAVSALDVSIQGQIINLLEDLQRRLGLAYLFIAHDLAVVRHISMRVVVMYFGRVMEVADRDEIYRNPLHPYTKVLLDAAPIPDPTVEKGREPRLIKGELPSHMSPPSGCVFNTRCPIASDECRQVIPPLEEKRPGHFAACIKV
ncbi:ABC transporter ATP-binding protein [Pseudorhodoplanes sinuspersici]|uniref:ABC transporter ATP-binding protein n=1 Tax=Pseudorhodoplanes sinuspersici TaxID=1235591 RepID=UPI000FF5F67C|nr:ABC transporter ATP-binding protein [Pseudorhodoplanes sinuspersici]RKE71048.1 peptide/nickel transport system ATP-binding protein [Pseudorhodoplanes sinuspersici]